MSTQPQITNHREKQDAKKKRCLLYSGQVGDLIRGVLTPPYYHQRKSKMTGARVKSFEWRLKQMDALHAKFVTGKFFLTAIDCEKFLQNSLHKGKNIFSYQFNWLSRLCYGQCNSFYIPNDDFSDPSAVFATCSTCEFIFTVNCWVRLN